MSEYRSRHEQVIKAIVLRLPKLLKKPLVSGSPTYERDRSFVDIWCASDRVLTLVPRERRPSIRLYANQGGVRLRLLIGGKIVANVWKWDYVPEYMPDRSKTVNDGLLLQREVEHLVRDVLTHFQFCGIELLYDPRPAFTRACDRCEYQACCLSNVISGGVIS